MKSPLISILCSILLPCFIASAQEKMTAERFRKLVATAGDSVPLGPQLAEAPFWRKAKCDIRMKYADGTRIHEELLVTAKTLEGKYVVFTAESKLYKQSVHAVMTYDQKAAAYKQWGLFGETLTEATCIFDMTKKISASTGTYPPGFMEISVGTFSDQESFDRTQVYKDGVLFMTRESRTRSMTNPMLSLVIPDDKLEGSPKEIVAQLNTLTKKYDLPTHTGMRIRFDPAVDSQCCSMGIFRGGEPLAFWIDAVCDSCGATYRVDGPEVVIELLPLSDMRTADLEAHLTNGLPELCRQFRAERGQDRYALGQKIFNLLPHSPVTSSKEAGINRFVTYDYEHPTYKLYKRDVIALLGQPDRNVNNRQFYYSLRPGGATNWELGVEFDEGEYVRNPSLTGVSRK